MAKREPIKGRLGTNAFFSQHDSHPESQQDSVPSDQQTNESASQQTGKVTPQWVKATFYLTPDLVLKLEEVRMARLRRGDKVDKSALVREALAQLAS